MKNSDMKTKKYSAVFNYHSIEGSCKVKIDDFESDSYLNAMKHADDVSLGLEREHVFWVHPNASWSLGHERDGVKQWNKMYRFCKFETQKYSVPFGSQYNIILKENL